MKHFLRILALLALFAFPSGAEAAARFAVCTTTCTWDNTSTAMWSTSSGGATGASAPVAGDDVTINASTCVGGTTCTITTFAGTISAASIAWGTCTASTTGCIIDASVNNTNFTLSSSGGTPFNGSGTGTRKWLGGTGTYTVTATGANPHFDMSTTTGDLGSVFSSATWIAGGNTTTNGGGWTSGGFSFGPFTISGNTSRGSFAFTGNATFSSLTIGAPSYVNIVSGTQTVTGALTLNGTSSLPVVIASNSANVTATISLGAASSGTWAAFRAITTSGAAAFTSSTCLDLGRNTFANSGNCTSPSTGGGGGRIIGG